MLLAGLSWYHAGSHKLHLKLVVFLSLLPLQVVLLLRLALLRSRLAPSGREVLLALMLQNRTQKGGVHI